LGVAAGAVKSITEQGASRTRRRATLPRKWMQHHLLFQCTGNDHINFLASERT
jgi:hypothetical protein